jgi:intracellular multiplication protein IcmG
MSEQDKFNSEEEYHFVDDPELISAQDTLHSEDEISATSEVSATQRPFLKLSQLIKLENITAAAKPILELLQKNLALRLILLGGGLLLLALVIYRCTGNHNNIAAHATHAIPASPITRESPLQIQNPPKPAEQINKDISDVNGSISSKKLIDLKSTQTNLQVQVNELNNQVSGVDGKLGIAMDNLKQLSDQMSQLASAVQEQAKITSALTSQLQQNEKQTVASTSKPYTFVMPAVRYFLKAVIPGRAWLIDSNGNTYTVREGSKLANYGTIRFIDARRSRVLTSSGKIIAFSQDDN